jgi:hypothetical protein
VVAFATNDQCGSGEACTEQDRIKRGLGLGIRVRAYGGVMHFDVQLVLVGADFEGLSAPVRAEHTTVPAGR